MQAVGYSHLADSASAQSTEQMPVRRSDRRRQWVEQWGAINRWLSAIRSADPENPCLESNMEWIGCTVCEIFAFELKLWVEIGVLGHSDALRFMQRETFGDEKLEWWAYRTVKEFQW